MAGQVSIIRGNALALPLADDSVDLVVTSPPYFGLRSYQDGGEHYDGQIGAEATPTEFVDALIAATREMVRVTKPSGSIWVNLGDKYAGSNGMPGGAVSSSLVGQARAHAAAGTGKRRPAATGAPAKSLIGIPWRYAIRCIDDLGLILRAEVIWSKPNGLPESVTDRVRRSHEQWFHFTLNPRYYSAVDEVREEHTCSRDRGPSPRTKGGTGRGDTETPTTTQRNPLGKPPGSVWTIATEPLRVPDHLGIDHFAAFPTEWPRRIITGWSPRGVCVECGEGRRPVATKPELTDEGRALAASRKVASVDYNEKVDTGGPITASFIEKRGLSGTELARLTRPATITGYACDCPEPTAPTTPGVVLDPFGGTGTTALVADALGRHGISVDMSADYCRLAEWRTSDPKQQAKAARREYRPEPEQVTGQESLLDLIGGTA